MDAFKDGLFHKTYLDNAPAVFGLLQFSLRE
jgi:hypothetical protein